MAMILVGMGCASSTQLVSSQKSPEYTGGPVKKVAVLLIDDRHMYREVVENHFYNAITASGQPATVTHTILSLNQIKESEEESAALVRNAGADSVLVIRLVSRSTTSSLIRETTRYAPTVSGFSSYYGWHQYATIAYQDMSVIRGNSEVELFFETSLYDLSSGKLLWIGLTKGTIKEQTDRVDAAQTFLKDVVEKLRADGLLK